MLDLSFFLGPLLESTSGHWLGGQEARKNFENDVRLFLEKQKRDTSLDVFFFANRPDIRDDKEYLRLEDIYIPIRLRQIRESLPDREDFLQNFDVKTAKNRKEPKLPDGLNIAQLLTKMASGHQDRQIMLIGNGGSGKSTLMKYLARFFAEKTDRNVRILVEEGKKLKEKQVKINNHYFPIFIRLRDLEQILRQHNKPNWEDNFNLAHFLQAKHGLQFATEQFYAKVLQQVPCLILLDGVDEVPEYKDCGNGLIISRRKIMNWINMQVKVFSAAHPKTSFILTSRPADLSLLARSFQVFELKGFSEGEIRLFTEYWYQAYEKMLHYCVRAEIHGSRKDTYQRKIELLPENKGRFLENLDNPHLTELINNPLLLSQAILIHSIDESFELSDIDSLYEKFIDTLLYRWDDVRQMNFYPELLGSRNTQRLFQLMGRIALAFSKREVTKMTFDDLLPEVVKAVSRFKSSLPQPDKIVDLATELLDVMRDRGGIFTGGVIAEDRNQTEYEFQHKSIQDYLTAHTLATDHGLWHFDGFDLFEVIDRREFWGRTLEFFVNIKKGNPDGFFRAYLECLKPKTDYAKKLNHFTYYFLLAKEKDDGLENNLINKCEEILLYSPDFIEIQVSQLSLTKFSIQLTASHLVLIKTIHSNLLDNFRAVKLVQLFCIKGKGIELISILRETSLLQQIEIESGKFYRYRSYCFLGLIQKDYEIWKNLLSLEENVPDFLRFTQGLVLIHLQTFGYLQHCNDPLYLQVSQDSIDVLDLLASLNFLPPHDVLNLLDLRSLNGSLDLQYSLYMHDLWDLRSLQDWKEWQNHKYWRSFHDWHDLLLFEKKLLLKARRRIQSSKFSNFLSEFQKISERFHALTPEQKRQYFINVDE